MAHRSATDALHGMPAADLCDCWNHLRRHSKTAPGLVSSCVVFDEPEVWRQCAGAPACFGLLAPQNATRYGSPRTRPPERSSGGRRDLCWWEGRRYVGRHTEKKAIVVVAVEVKELKGFGRVRLHRSSGDPAHVALPGVRCVAVEERERSGYPLLHDYRRPELGRCGPRRECRRAGVLSALGKWFQAIGPINQAHPEPPPLRRPAARRGRG